MNERETQRTETRRQAERGNAMGTVIPFPQRGRVLSLSREELWAELRAKEDELVLVEQELYAVAQALWPEDRETATRAPERYREFKDFETAEIIRGIQLLHVLTNQLIAENAALRERAFAKELADV